MRILLDECVNTRLRQAFAGHEVFTVAEAAWHALRDNRLIALAHGKIDVLVTIDRGFEFEHNLQKLSFGIVVVHAAKNRLEYYRPLFAELASAVDACQPGQVLHVGQAGKGR